MVFPWFFNGFSMVFQWIFNGFSYVSMVFICFHVDDNSPFSSL